MGMYTLFRQLVLRSSIIVRNQFPEHKKRKHDQNKFSAYEAEILQIDENLRDEWVEIGGNEIEVNLGQ